MRSPQNRIGVTKIRVAEFANGELPVEHDAVEAKRLRENSRGFVWIHLVAGMRDEAVQFLREELGFHPLEVEDALSVTERPTVVERPGTLFMVCVALDQMETRERFHEIAFFVGKGFLVTVVLEEDASVNQLFDDCLSGIVRDAVAPSNLLYRILDQAVDAYFPGLDALQRDINALEEAVFRGDQMRMKSALRIKRRLLEFRRNLTPMRDELNALLRRESEMIPNRMKPYFQDIYDHCLRLIESVDLERDILATLLDAHLSLVSNRLNEVMRAMTVLATVLMSASLISGIYGMNFKHMPELDWKFGYPLAIGSMIFVAALELHLFKKKGWL